VDSNTKGTNQMFTNPTLAEVIALIPVVLILVASIPLVYIDLTQKRLPNKITYPTILVALVSGVTASAISGEWLRLVFAFLIAFCFFVALFLISLRGFIGMGDAKVMFAMTLSLSWFSPLLGGLVFIVTAVVTALAAIAYYRLRRYTIALAPFMFLSYIGLVVIGSVA
jgi:leader peptidase (prepilin peptidase) / N-methyltransferase